MLGPEVNLTFVAHGQSTGIFALRLLLVLLLVQAWYPPTAVAINRPAWSLSVEWFFYLLFPALFSFAARLSRYHWLLAAYGFVVSMSVMRGSISLPESYPSKLFLAYSPLFHLPQFVFGMALGRLFLFGPKLTPCTHTAMLACGVGALALFLGLPSWLQTNAILVLLFGLIIVGGATVKGPILANPVLVLLGEASYSMYILQEPFLLWWSNASKALGLTLNTQLELILCLILLAVLSVLCFIYVERPLRRALSGKLADGGMR